MPQLIPSKKEKLLKLLKVRKGGDMALLKEILDLREQLEEKLTQIKLKKGDKGDKPTKQELLEIIKPLIPKVENGEDYILTEKDRKDIAKSISVPVVEKVIEKTEVVKEQPIEVIKEVAVFDKEEAKEEIVKDLPQFGEQFRDGLELLQGDDRLDIKAIKGWEALEKRIEAVNNVASTNHSIVGRDIITDIDISDDLDGVTKTVNIQAVYNIISVSLSSYPYGTLRKNIDYTFTNTSITFTDEIAASTQLSAGQKCIITAVLA